MKTRSAIFSLGMVAILGMFAVADPAQAQDKLIKIGGLFPMSGPGAYFGAQDKQGIELAIAQFNKTGVNGYKLEVKFEDSACSPLPATQAAKRLLEQYKPLVVAGEECSDATLAVMPVMEQAKVAAAQCRLIFDQDH
jgi:branched-chain amino acid transport system substrate-binding protein